MISFPFLKVNIELLGDNEKYFINEIFWSDVLKWALEVKIANRSLSQFPWDPRMLSLPLQQKISLLQDLRFKQRRLEYCFLLQTKSSLLSYLLRKELLCRSLGLITPFLPDAPTLVQVIIYCLGGHMSGLQAKTQWTQAVYSVLCGFLPGWSFVQETVVWGVLLVIL